MKTIFILFVTILIAFNAKGQTIKEVTNALNKINDIDQISNLKSKYPKWNIYSDRTRYSDSIKYPEIINAKIGDIIITPFDSNANNFAIKVLAEQEEELCKVKYIYLDGSSLSKSSIDSIRTIIIKRYHSGENFELLAKEYNMDGNTTGDLAWFNKDMMVKEFDVAVRTRKKGEIFPVDVNEKKWYYVVLKTYNNRMEKVKISIRVEYFKNKEAAEKSNSESVDERMPMYPGGEKELYKYLQKNFKYPESALRDSIQGRVMVGFRISEFGIVDSAMIISGVRSDIDSAAIKLILDMPKWTPGMMKGKNVPVKYSMPINFSFK